MWIILGNWINMPDTVNNAIIYVIVLLTISYLYKDIIKLTKQYILKHNLYKFYASVSYSHLCYLCILIPNNEPTDFQFQLKIICIKVFLQLQMVNYSNMTSLCRYHFSYLCIILILQTVPMFSVVCMQKGYMVNSPFNICY